MLKRKYGNHSSWKRILKSRYGQTYLDTEEFKGYITLLHIEKVTEPLLVKYADKNICIADDGYMWLQQFPLDKKHVVTTMFDADGNVVQWYIDVCFETGHTDNIPWMDDLFLDIVVLPSGEIFQLDDDELEVALLSKVIDESLYDLARREARCITELIVEDKFNLLQLSYNHKGLLLGELR